MPSERNWVLRTAPNPVRVLPRSHLTYKVISAAIRGGTVRSDNRPYRRRHWLGLSLFLSIAISAVSTCLHFPTGPAPFGNLGLKYSDIVFGVFYPRFSLERGDSLKYWYNAEALKHLMEGGDVCPTPYIDYQFEYPPVVGLLWYFTTCLSIRIASEGEARRPPADSYVTRLAELHFILNAIILSLSLLLSALLACRLVFALGEELSPQDALLWLALPSTLLYAVYNWDVICLALALGSLLALQERRHFISGALLGLSIATKLMTASMAYAISLYLLLVPRDGPRSREFVSFLTGLLAFGATPYVTLLMFSPKGLFDFIAHHSTWYCENCLYLLFIRDVFSHLHRLLAAASACLLATGVALLVIAKKGAKDRLWLYRLSTLSILGAVLFNYVFSPQMVLLFSPLVMVFFGKMSRVMYVASDVANFFIMFLFFNDSDLRYLLNSLGFPIDVRFSPWTIDSPVQWFSAIRNTLLLAIFVIELVKLSKSG